MGTKDAESAEVSANDPEVSFSQLVAVEHARLPGYCAPVFPQEGHVAPVPKGRLTSVCSFLNAFLSRCWPSLCMLSCCGA